MEKRQTKSIRNSFEKLEKDFLSHKKKAGNPLYAACFGKTFLGEEEKEYVLAQKVGKLVIEYGFGVLHGGYIGVMEAISKGADQAIGEAGKSKNQHWNIGIPMKMFDVELRRSSRVNLPPADNIGDRKRALLEFCDICIVLPTGGFGTFVETLELFHMNQLAQKFGGKVRPIILFGRRWKTLLSTAYKTLDMRSQKGGEDFVYFVNSTKELESVLENIKQNIL